MWSRNFVLTNGRRVAAIALALAMALVSTLVASANVPITNILVDPYTNSTSQHKTIVEPDSFSFGSTIVASGQTGRFYDGGASNLGWSTSTDGGSTWSSGTLPGTTVYSSPTGPWARVTDPSVAYDPAHGVWLINGLGLKQVGSSIIGTDVFVNRSTNGGTTWGNPVIVRTVTGNQNFDKNWITCDTFAASPYYGRCYVEYDDYGNGNAIHMAYSADGGLTWTESSVPAIAVIGGQPVAQPNGTVVVPIDNAYETALGSIVSTNGGVSYSNVVTITSINDHTVAGNMRTGPLPSAEVDGAGKVYVVWQDCRFRRACKANDIVMTTSSNGTTWSSIVRIPIDPTNSGVEHFMPGIAVDKGTSGSTAHIAVTYYYYPVANCGSSCQVDVGYISSTNGGASWSPAVQIAGPMTLSWLPNTSQGRMLGDYISSSFANGLAFGFFPVASAPTSGGSDCYTATPNCNQPLFTTTTGRTAASSVVVTASGDHAVPNAASDHAAPASPITIR